MLTTQRRANRPIRRHRQRWQVAWPAAAANIFFSRAEPGATYLLTPPRDLHTACTLNSGYSICRTSGRDCAQSNHSSQARTASVGADHAHRSAPRGESRPCCLRNDVPRRFPRSMGRYSHESPTSRPATSNSTHGGINSQTLCIVDIFVASQASIDALPQQAQQGVLRVLAMTRIVRPQPGAHRRRRVVQGPAEPSRRRCCPGVGVRQGNPAWPSSRQLDAAQGCVRGRIGLCFAARLVTLAGIHKRC